MFRKREKEIRVYTRREMIEMYTQLIKELEDVYLPIRDECEEVIRSHGLNHYPLRDVLELRMDKDSPEYEIVIYDIKDDWWDGEKCLKKTDILLDEKFRLDFVHEWYSKGNICKTYYEFCYDLLGRLNDPTDEYRKRLSFIRKREDNK